MSAKARKASLEGDIVTGNGGDSVLGNFFNLFTLYRLTFIKIYVIIRNSFTFYDHAIKTAMNMPIKLDFIFFLPPQSPGLS